MPSIYRTCVPFLWKCPVSDGAKFIQRDDEVTVRKVNAERHFAHALHQPGHEAAPGVGVLQSPGKQDEDSERGVQVNRHFDAHAFAVERILPPRFGHRQRDGQQQSRAEWRQAVAARVARQPYAEYKKETVDREWGTVDKERQFVPLDVEIIVNCRDRREAEKGKQNYPPY